jgi:HEAT repeat protein
MARKALVSIGMPAIPALTEALRHEDALTRVHAARALWSLQKQPGKVIPVLLQAWQDPALFLKDECIRNEASVTLGEIGKEQPDRILPILVGALQGKDEKIVGAATVPLAMMGVHEKRAVAALVGLLGDPRRSYLAGRRLREVGPAAIPHLLDALKADDPRTRWGAAWTIGGMEPGQAAPARPSSRW